MGIVVGSDQHQQWLLPWWWRHFSARNRTPVLFVDFGMSQEALAFCKERGSILPMRDQLQLKEPAPKTKALWEEHFGKTIWQRRLTWFKKPSAILQAPFEIGLWLDLDCEVRGDLAPLFRCMELGFEIALKPEPQKSQQLYQTIGFCVPGEINYNSGVLLFRKGAKVLQRWAAKGGEQFPGDQEALSRAIFETNPSLLALPETYNWCPLMGDIHPEALIVHYQGEFLKNELKIKGYIKTERRGQG